MLVFFWSSFVFEFCLARFSFLQFLSLIEYLWFVCDFGKIFVGF